MDSRVNRTYRRTSKHLELLARARSRFSGHTKETKLRISKSLKGIKRGPWSEERKKKFGDLIRGRVKTPEEIQKIRNSIKLRWDRIGRKQYKRYVHLTSRRIYREWRQKVFGRDNFTCRGCGLHGVYLEAHHVKSWAKFPESRFDVNNGLTLCKGCHKLTDNYKGKNHE